MKIPAVLLLLVGIGSTGAGAQDSSSVAALSAEEVRAAIAEGSRSRVGLELAFGDRGVAAALCGAGPPEGSCGYHVWIQGPYGRVRSKAAANAKKYLPFTVDSIGRDDVAPELMVRVEPVGPRVVSGRPLIPPALVHVVLIAASRRGHPEPAAIQPVRVDTIAVSWANLAGASGTSVGLVARFPLSAVPTGDFAVVAVTTGREARYGVTARHRPLIR